MPIINIDELEEKSILGFRPQAAPDESYSTPEVFKAAFRTENSVGSAIADETPLMRPNRDYDPFDDISGYEVHAGSFVNAGSNEDVSRIKSQIDRENADRELLRDSGWVGTAASFAAGILDPVNLIPVGGAAVKAYTLGGSILKGAAAIARAGIIGSTIAETALHSTQETRTLGESAGNIAGATILSGILGGAIGAIGRRGVMELGSQLEKELIVPHPDAPDVMEPNGITLGNDSVGAMRVKETTLAEETLAKAWGMEKGFARLNPKLRLSTSHSIESRRYVQELIETPFYYEKNDAGIANPVAIETIINMQDSRLAKAVSGQGDIFKAYRQRPKNEKNLSYLQFREETAKALRRNDVHAIPEVQQLAQLYRKEIFDPMKDAAIQVKLLPEDVKVTTADSYLHRWWDKEKVTGKRQELVPILSAGLKRIYSEQQEAFTRKIGKKQKNLESEISDLSDANLRDEQQFIESGGQFTEQEILDAIRLVESPPKKPETLISFLHKQGGLKDDAGELKTIGLTHKSRPGFVRAKGQNLDDAALRAWENGFFPQFQERPSVNDLLDAIREDYQGNLVVRQEDAGYAQELERLADVQRALDELGINTEKFKGVKSLGDFDTSGIKKAINDIQAGRRLEKVKGLTAKLEEIKGDRLVDLSPDEFDLIANEIIDNILGHADTRIPYDIPITVRGPLKERVLNFIRDEEVEQFLVNDIEAVAKKYVRTMAPDIAIKERFGDLNIIGKEGVITQKINEDYTNLSNAAKTERERAFLEKRQKSDIRDIEAVVNQLRGTYGIPDNPDSIIVRAARATRQINYVSKLGGMTASSFSDIGRPVMAHGLMRTFGDGIIPLVTNLRALKLAAREVKEASVGLDMVLDTRAMSMAELNDPYVKGTKFEKGLQSLSNTFGKVTLMAPWNTAMKQFAGVVTQARIIKDTKKLIEGKLSANDTRYLNMIGIDADTAKGIVRQIAKHGTDVDGVMIANAKYWDDLVAQRVFRAALRKEADRIIVTPGHGDLPLLFRSTEAGKVISQFRSFSFAATNKILISGLQEKDAMAINGWVLSVSLGMMSYAFKIWDRGDELSDDPKVWLFEGIDRSGVLGALAEVNQVSNKLTRGNISLQALAGAPPLTRYSAVNAWGTVLGPTFGTGQDIFQVVGSATNADWTKSDSRALRRMIPYQNLMIARQLFDEMESSINDSLGVK